MENKLIIHEYNLLSPDEKYSVDMAVYCLQRSFINVSRAN